MSLYDPYRELELYLEQINNEINQVLEQTNKDTKPKITEKDKDVTDALNAKGPMQNDGQISPEASDFDVDTLFSTFDSQIASDLKELLARYEGSQENLENNAKDGFDTESEKIYSSSQSPNSSECFWEKDSINELNFSQYLQNSPTQAAIQQNGGSFLTNTATQTSPSPSQSSTNLTWASECSSSPCLTSTSDQEQADDSRSSTPSDTGQKQQTFDPFWKPNELSTKSSSAPVLKKEIHKVSRQSRSQSDRHLSEIEATEACKWLRAAGFPQYAQMYEDMQFPVDLSAAEQDHPQLEPSALHSLFRRLHSLNRCARIHQQRILHTDDSEDENCALSNNWTYQSDIRRWSRNCQNLQIPKIEEPNNKERWRCSMTYSKDIRDVDSPKDRLRRSGSTKYHRKRDGVVICDSRNDVIDMLSKQLTDFNTIDSNSDVGSSGRNSRRRKSRSLDKSDSIYNSPCHLSERSFFNDKLYEGVVLNDEPKKCEEQGSKPISNLSCTQLQVLRKLALLKLTALMEKYCLPHRTGWNWDFPKFIKKMKSPVYRDRAVFGVPLTVILQRTGLPLPRGIEEALHWLRQNATDQVGLFRKPGVRSRIQSLKLMVEARKENLSFTEQQAYDVADMVKLFFRELPEALLTTKLSETFILIFQHVPPYLRSEAVVCALLLMPDEHCEVLQILLNFLNSIAKYADVNQMNESNLALCFAPSLFHHTHIPVNRYGSGTMHPKELAETKAAQECILFLLKNSNNLFKITKEFLNQCKSEEIKDWTAVQLSQLGTECNGDWHTYLQDCQNALLKEAREKTRGWILVPSHFFKIEIQCKKVADGHPLRLWKVCAEIEAPPSEVVHRIIRERHIWDEELQSTRIISQIEKRSEIFQYSRRNIFPLPIEDYCVVRTWKTDLPKGACLIVETSVEHPDAMVIPNSTRGIVLASRYFIEPCGSGKSRLLHMSRVDTRGRMPEWYHKNFGHICALLISNIQRSFQQTATGPESKV